MNRKNKGMNIVEQKDQLNETVENENDSDINEMDESGFLPKELLLEEKRLQEELRIKDEEAKLKELDENERKKRFQNLLVLLENSKKLTDLFEARLKKCKLQIIRKELQKAKEFTENALNNDEDIDEDKYYLDLFQQPKLFHGHLKIHQIEGLLWIRNLYENGLNGILADEMGLGKTIQAIAFYCFLIEMGVTGPFLVIVPLSTVPNWLSEFSKFSPQLQTLLYHGSEKERIKIRLKFNDTYEVNNLTCYQIIITTYDVVRFDIQFLKSINWKYIIFDEGHKMKNINAIISNSMRHFTCGNKLILTGTPIQNDMEELWSLLNLLMPRLFDNLENFNSWLVIDSFFDSNDKIASMAKKDEILDIMQKILKPFILRREKKETDLNLPPKKEIVVYAPLTDKQHELYKATLDKNYEILFQTKDTDNIQEIMPKRKCVEVIKKYTSNVAIRHALPEQNEDKLKNMSISIIHKTFIQLKKIANHPYLVHLPLIPGTKEVFVDENIVKVSGKFQVLDAMLTKLKLRGHKVLLFSTMVMILDLIEDYLILRKFKYTRLDGTMNIQSRIEAMKTFNTDPDYFLMIISTRAGGLGLNLTSADTVIIFDNDWNPQCDLQAQDRCHRMGQDKPVVVYHLCSKNTIDEHILKRASAKRKLERMIFGGGIFSRNIKNTNAEIEDLMNLLKSTDYHKKIQSNGFIFTDEELDALLDRSDMSESVSNATSKSAEHFSVLTNS